MADPDIRLMADSDIADSLIKQDPEIADTRPLLDAKIEDTRLENVQEQVT